MPMTSTAGSSQARLWAWSWSSLPTTRSRLGVSAAGNDPKVTKRALADPSAHLREGTAALCHSVERLVLDTVFVTFGMQWTGLSSTLHSANDPSIGQQ